MEYSVVKREINLGLMNQWFNIWEPKHDRELAFVFEDDLDVFVLFIYYYYYYYYYLFHYC